MVAIAVELATAYVSIAASAKGIGQSIQSELGDPLAKAGDKAGEESSTRFGSSFKTGIGKAAKVAAVAFGAGLAGAAIFGKQAIDVASDVEESLSKVTTVFGDQGGAIEQWANSAATSIGLAKGEALDAAGGFGNMFTQLGIGNVAAADMSIGISNLAADFASFHNADITEVLDAQSAAFRGEYDSLQRFLPLINAASVEQKAMAMTGKANADELTSQEKALATYELMLEGAGAAQGDFNRTSDGLANQQRILSAQWKNMQATIGKALIPVMAAVVSFLSEKMIPTIKSLAAVWLPRIAAGVKAFAEAAVSVKDAVVDAFGFIMDNQPLLAGLATFIGTVLVGAMVSWATATWAQVTAYYALHAAQILAMAKFVAIAAAIAAVVAAVIYAYQNWEWFRTVVDSVRDWFVNTFWPALQSVFGWLRDNVPPILQAIADFFTTKVLPAIQAVWSFIQDQLWPIFRTFGEFLLNAYVAYVQAVIDVITTLWGWLQTLWDRSEGLRSFLASAFRLAFDIVVTAIGAVSTAVSTLWGWIQTLWDRSEGFRSFLAGAFWLAVTIVSTAFDAVATAVSAVWGWFQSAWDKAKEIAAYFEGAFNTAIGIVSTAFDGIGSAVGGVIDAFRTVVDWLKNIIGWADKAISKIKEVLNGKSLFGDTNLAALAGADGLATGGPMRAGQPYIVGEKGWELVVPQRSGYVIPHDESVAMLSGGTSRGGVTIEQANFYDATDIDGFARSMNMQLAMA